MPSVLGPGWVLVLLCCGLTHVTDTSEVSFQAVEKPFQACQEIISLCLGGCGVQKTLTVLGWRLPPGLSMVFMTLLKFTV